MLQDVQSRDQNLAPFAVADDNCLTLQTSDIEVKSRTTLEQDLAEAEVQDSNESADDGHLAPAHYAYDETPATQFLVTTPSDTEHSNASDGTPAPVEHINSETLSNPTSHTTPWSIEFCLKDRYGHSNKASDTEDLHAHVSRSWRLVCHVIDKRWVIEPVTGGHGVSGPEEKGDAEATEDTNFRKKHKDGANVNAVSIQEADFPEVSLTSIGHTLGDGPLTSRDLMSVLTSDLLCVHDIATLNHSVVHDLEIDDERFRHNIELMIRCLGKDLIREAESPVQFDAAQVLRTKSFSRSAAHVVWVYAKQLQDTEAGLLIPHCVAALLDHMPPCDERMEASVAGALELEEHTISAAIDREIEDIRRFFVESEAYKAYKDLLLSFAHQRYAERIARALGDTVYGDSGKREMPVSVQCAAQELAWVPPQLLYIYDITAHSHEQQVGERIMVKARQWWPFSYSVRNTSSRLLVSDMARPY